MQTEVCTDVLAQIVESVFLTMMELEVVRCDKPWNSIGDG